MSTSLITPGSRQTRASYEQMACVFDEFTAHHNHALWIEGLLEVLERHGLAGRRLLDVACGTGKSFLPLLDGGWQITGCDLSQAMLARARAKTNGRARLEVADLRRLPVLGSFDLIWCLGDAVNYMIDDADLLACLGGLRANLAPKGRLLLDFNTLRTYRTLYAEEQVLERGSWRFSWLGQADRDMGPGGMAEALFQAEPLNGATSSNAISAPHRQRHIAPGQILESLDRRGLECLAYFGQGLDGQLQQPLDESLHTKAIFIAKRARRR